MTADERYLSSESVTEGHPDKVCDFIADSVLDALLSGDPGSRVACEVLCKGAHVVLAGEITSDATVEYERVVRDAVRAIGYVEPGEPFSADALEVTSLLTRQAPEIARAVSGEGRASDRAGREGDAGSRVAAEQGAGDQGVMFGYATDETPELMPLPILLGHRLTRGLAEDRKGGAAPWLRPDGKAQVTVRYRDDRPREVTRVVVSTQHRPGEGGKIGEYVRDGLLPRAVGGWLAPAARIDVNPSGSFVEGGPSVDCGVTGRKIIVDTYGCAARHGGGSFSGKDPSKVDRSGAYFCRFAARRLVRAGLARRAEVQVAYAIGVAEPVSVDVETFGTGDRREALEILEGLDFRPAAIIERLGLLRPIYRGTTNYGHFGRPGLPWEE